VCTGSASEFVCMGLVCVWCRCEVGRENVRSRSVTATGVWQIARSSSSGRQGADRWSRSQELGLHPPGWLCGHSGEVTPEASQDADSTRKGAFAGYKLNPMGEGNERQGPPSTVGEVIAPHWTATASLKLGSPQPVRCCLASTYLPHWVYGDQRGIPRKVGR